MKIQVGGLSEGLHSFHFETPSAELGLAENFARDVVTDVVLEKTGTQLFLKAVICAEGRFTCDRCLTEFDAPLTSSYRMYYMPEGSEGTNVDPSEAQVIPAGTSTIDLTEDVRQTILLSVPLKLLCSENCEGLCPRCGANLNTGSCTCTDTPIDTRWEKLRPLRDKITEDPT